MAFYMIFDNPEDKKNMSFLDRYKYMNIEFIYPKKKCNSIQDMLRECNHLLRRSNKGDTIICWYDFMAVLCWVLCKIQFKRRKIVALNILLKDKSTYKNRLAKLLYKAMLSSIMCTCNCYFKKIWSVFKQSVKTSQELFFAS